MKQNKIRLGVLCLTITVVLACASAANAGTPITINVGGFAGQATAGSNASCFSEYNGGVLSNGTCPGAPAWEMALAADWNTPVMDVQLYANQAAQNTVVCTLTSMMWDDQGYSQVTETVGGNTTSDVQGIPITSIEDATVSAWNYLYCAMPRGAILYGVQYSDYSE